DNLWTLRNAGGQFFLATSTATATSSASVLSISSSGIVTATNGIFSATSTVTGAAYAGTSLQSPLLIGNSTAGGTLTLKSTSGSGTSDAIIFQVHSNGGTEGGRFLTTGQLALGTTTAPTFGNTLVVGSSTAPQFALSDNAGADNLWTLRNAGGQLFLATSTATATSSVSALSLNTSGGLSVN